MPPSRVSSVAQILGFSRGLSEINEEINEDKMGVLVRVKYRMSYLLTHPVTMKS